MSLLFDPTTIRKRRGRDVPHTERKPKRRRRNFDSLIDSIGELPIEVELGIDYDDKLEKDTRDHTLTLEMFGREKLNAEQILKRINKSLQKKFYVPFDKIVILMRTNVDVYINITQQVEWDHVDVSQCYVKFRYPILMLIRLAFTYPTHEL